MTTMMSLGQSTTLFHAVVEMARGSDAALPNKAAAGMQGRVVGEQNLLHAVVDIVLVGPDWVDLNLVHCRLDACIRENVLQRPQSQRLRAWSNCDYRSLVERGMVLAKPGAKQQ